MFEPATPSYPVQLHVADWPVLVVGGGEVAARKVKRLLECGARVTVVAPEAVAELSWLAETGTITWNSRPFTAEDVLGARLVFAATGDRELNWSIAAAAAAIGALANVADDPAAGSFHLPAQIRRGHLQVNIATEGGAPFVARRLRQRWEKRLKPEWEPWLAEAARFRAEVRARIPDPADRQRLYDRFVDAALGDGEGPPATSDPAVWSDWIAAESAGADPPAQKDGEGA